jgi:hypothetical protein
MRESVDIRWPTPAEAAAVAGLIGMVAQYFGVTVPQETRADANKASNFAARDALAQCNVERLEWRDRYISLMEGDSP